MEEKRNSAGSWFFSNDLVPIMLPLLVRITHALQTKEEIGRRDVSDSRQRILIPPEEQVLAVPCENGTDP